VNHKTPLGFVAFYAVVSLWSCGKKETKKKNIQAIDERSGASQEGASATAKSPTATAFSEAEVELLHWQPALPAEMKAENIKLVMRNGDQISLHTFEGEKVELNIESRSIQKVDAPSLPLKAAGSKRILVGSESAWEWSDDGISLFLWDKKNLALQKISVALKDLSLAPHSWRMQSATSSSLLALVPDGLLMTKLENNGLKISTFKYPKVPELDQSLVSSGGMVDESPWFLAGLNLFYPFSRNSKAEAWEYIKTKMNSGSVPLPTTQLSQPELVKSPPQNVAIGITIWTEQGLFWTKIAKPAQISEPLPPITGTKGPGGGTADTSWEEIAKPIFLSKCSGCHTSHQSWMSGTSFERSLIVLEKGKISNRIMGTGAVKMPPYGVPELSDTEKQKLNSWLQNAQ
jgi:hypothetical protein